MTIRNRLARRFQDREYRSTYVDGFLDSYIAAQIHALREAREFRQDELAKLIGTKQSGISKLENVNYSGWSIRTLRKLAKAFDVALVVKFVAFSEALTEIENFNVRDLVKPTFPQDPTFLNVEALTVSAMTAVLGPVVQAHIRVSSHRLHTHTSYIQTERTVGDLLTSPQV